MAHRLSGQTSRVEGCQTSLNDDKDPWPREVCPDNLSGMLKVSKRRSCDGSSDGTFMRIHGKSAELHSFEGSVGLH